MHAPEATTVATPVISCRGLHKWYGGVHALKGVDFDVMPGETIGLVGDNGAGKSTLINILSGVHRADEGMISFLGKPVKIRSARDARELGIETIYQYNSVVPTMSISRNLFLGREPLKWSIGGIGLMNQRLMDDASREAVEAVGLHLRSQDAVVSELSGGQRQGVAIARAMHFGSKVLILDEPTNHLAVRETENVLNFVRSLKLRGVNGIFVSHNLQHVLECSDRIVAMARGEVVMDRSAAGMDVKDLMEVL